jgi:hypothetical protein
MVTINVLAGATGDLPPGAQTWMYRWPDSLKATGYATATAHNPSFGDKALWPMLSGKEAFLKHPATPGRVLVWDIAAKKWSENGKVVDAVPDEKTDIILPDSDTPYSGALASPEETSGQLYRNVTVGRNAFFRGGGDGVGRRIAGNLWLKRGGRMYGNGALRFIGEGQVFIRNDNDKTENRNKADFVFLHQYFGFQKAGSIEVIGHVSVLDEFSVEDGCTLIISPFSRVQPGRSASPIIRKGGTIALLDGAYWGKWCNEFHRATDLTVEGTLQGGLPDRPLTRDAYVGVSFRNWQKINFSKVPGGAMTDKDGAVNERMEQKKGIKDLRLISLIVRGTGVIRSFSQDPAKASLVIGWTGIENTNVIGDPRPKDGKPTGRFTTPEFATMFNAIPRKITVSVTKGAVLENVCFDDLHPGGILLGEAGMETSWKGIRWGAHNMEKESAKLYQVVSLTGRQETW